MQIQRLSGMSFQRKNSNFAMPKPIKHSNVRLNSTKSSKRISGFALIGAIAVITAGTVMLLRKNKTNIIPDSFKEKVKGLFYNKNIKKPIPQNPSIQKVKSQIDNKTVNKAADAAVQIKESAEVEKISAEILTQAEKAEKINPEVIVQADEVQKVNPEILAKTPEVEQAPEVLYGSYEVPSFSEQPISYKPIERHRRIDRRVLNFEKPYTMQSGQLEQRIADAPKVYAQLGVSDKIKESVEGLSVEMVDAISDDGFLSILIAPSDNIKLSTKEKALIAKNIGKRKDLKPVLQRKYNIERIVFDIAGDDARIAKIRELEDLFTPKEIQSIMQGTGMNAKVKRNDLLKFMIGFNTKKEEEKLYQSLIS